MSQKEKLRKLLESKKNASKPQEEETVEDVETKIARLEKEKAELEKEVADGKEEEEESEDDDEESEDDDEPEPEVITPKEEKKPEEPKKIVINPLVDDGLYREEFLARMNYLCQEVHKIAEALK